LLHVTRKLSNFVAQPAIEATSWRPGEDSSPNLCFWAMASKIFVPVDTFLFLNEDLQMVVVPLQAFAFVVLLLDLIFVIVSFV